MLGNAWHQRMFPYPLLASWTGDYVNRDFRLEGTKARLLSGAEITVQMKFRLTSEYLSDLIQSGFAQYAVTVSCPKTFAQTTHQLGEQDSLLLKASDYTERIQITPYIVSTRAIEGFMSREHAAEWREHRPKGFNIPEAGILAVGNITEVTIENAGVNSVIDLVADPNVDAGLVNVELGDQRIKIHVAPEDKMKIEALRQRKSLKDTGYAGLFASLYLAAVSEAIRQLSHHQDTRWAFAIGNALERCGVSYISDSEKVADQSLKYAQMILEHPMSGFLEAATGREDEV